VVALGIELLLFVISPNFPEEMLNFYGLGEDVIAGVEYEDRPSILSHENTVCSDEFADSLEESKGESIYGMWRVFQLALMRGGAYDLRRRGVVRCQGLQVQSISGRDHRSKSEQADLPDREFPVDLNNRGGEDESLGPEAECGCLVQEGGANDAAEAFTIPEDGDVWVSGLNPKREAGKVLEPAVWAVEITDPLQYGIVSHASKFVRVDGDATFSEVFS